MTVFVRIFLRYLAAILVARGVLLPDDGAALAGDPEVVSAVEVGLGALAALAAEAWYGLARRMGWKT